MPKIQWSDLPEALRKHLLLRLKERQVTEEDLLKLMEWRRSETRAGSWWNCPASATSPTSVAGGQSRGPASPARTGGSSTADVGRGSETTPPASTPKPPGGHTKELQVALGSVPG